MMDTIVIGAGWSGLTAATRLAAAGRSVVVVEKSRGPGGRSAARRHGEFSFDHGAQYLTARSDAFARQVDAWSAGGLLAPWRPELAVFGKRPSAARETPAERWVGVGGMNAVLRRLAAGVECRWRWHAESVGFEEGAWRVSSRDGDVLQARTLLVTAPPSQSATLLGSDHALSGLLHSVDMKPCWAIMVGFRDAPEVPFEAAFVNEGALSWIARCDAKAGRKSAPAWVGHAGAEWSKAHLDSEPGEVASALHAEMGRLAPGLASPPALCVAHRWRYAMASRALDGPILADDAQKLVLAGDWCAGERIEGAWISGVAAARRLDTFLP